jgi:hypothetical protein
VFVCADIEGLSKTYQAAGQTFRGFFADRFHSAMRLKVKVHTPIQDSLFRKDAIFADVSIYNPYPYSVDFTDRTFPVSLCACFFTKKYQQVCPVVLNFDLKRIGPGETLSGTITTVVPQDIPFGEYTFCFTGNSIFGPSLENEMFKTKIIKKGWTFN